MPRLPMLLALLVAPLLGGGCFGVDTSEPGTSSGGAPVATGSHGDGKLFIRWTLGGMPPSDATCAGVDHLELTLVYLDQTVTIAPIPCSLTRFRYDTLPVGVATLELDALDAQGCRMARGVVPDTLGATVPDSPQPTVAVPAPRACR